ncbi:MAG: redoxin domain-containing protein [Myxococcota bacterium]
MAIVAGRATPAFTLTGSEGRPVSLKDFRGKHAIVYFHPKDDTPRCTKEAQGFRASFCRAGCGDPFRRRGCVQGRRTARESGKKDLDKARKELEKGK